MVMDNQTWKQRMAKELSLVAPTAETVECALEAYAEMKTVRLKILLGRCYEILETSRSTNEEARTTETFENLILQELGGMPK